MTDLMVTGGSGLLGSAVRRLFPLATFISRHEADLRDRTEVTALFRRVRPRRVLHLAAWVGGVHANCERNADFFIDNVLINTNVLAAAYQEGVERLIGVLSSCAFPVSDRVVTESDLHTGSPFSGNLGYGYAKRMLDVQVHLMAQQYGWSCSTITPVTMYGPGDNCDPRRSHVVAALIQRCWQAQQEGEPFVVWGSGEAVRQFVFVDDVARVLGMLLKSSGGPDSVIVAPDRGITIRRLAELIAGKMGYHGPILFDHGKPEGVRVRRLRSARFSDYFPDFAFTSLEEGLQKTIAWFLGQRATRETTDRQQVCQ
ncbi:MAG: NAD-dependent epimerase/dehydratase family protein [Nitrospirota bacterium]